MANYDLIGNIAIVKFARKTSKAAKVKFGKALLRKQQNVTTVLEKTDRFKGRLRTLTTKHVAGEKTKEALYRENGCLFRLNVDTCYFSPRLSQERLDISKVVRKKESVLVMFGGVAPFAIVIAKHGKAARVVSVELGRECNKYALENVKRNKLQDKVEIVQGDVRKVLPKMKEKFDRIVMTRPNLEDPFLDVAFARIKKKGTIHYYGFCSEDELSTMVFMIKMQAREAKKKVNVIKIKKAGDIGPHAYRYRIDIRVLS